MMYKLEKIVAALTFCLLVVFVLVTWEKVFPLFASSLVQTLQGEKPINLFKDDLEEDLRDNMAWKKELTTVNSLAYYYAMHKVNATDVLMGKERWLFYKETFADYSGTHEYSAEEMERTAQNIDAMAQRLDAVGSRLTVLSPPNKSGVYEKYMPAYIVRASGPSRTDELLAYLQENTRAIVVNPRAKFEQYRDRYALYFKYDTHWNQLGAYIAVQQILQAWGVDVPALEEVRVQQQKLEYRVHASDDLANMAGIRFLLNDEMDYTVEESRQIDWTEYEAEQDRGYSHYTNDDAAYQKKVLLIGDSFRSSMVPNFAAMVSELYVIPRNQSTYFLAAEVLEEIRPDEVVLEVLERNSDQLQLYHIE